MKKAYPVIITKGDKYYLASCPDLEIDTQGKDIPDAIEMARDAISLCGITMQDMGNVVPEPGEMPAAGPDQVVTLVVVDFDAYRRANETRAVRKTVSIPAWMDDRASEQGLSLSRVLQEALSAKLGIEKR